MRLLADLLLLIAVIVLSPIWAARAWKRGKRRADWAGRLGRGPSLPLAGTRRILIHAVSVGEVNAIRLLVQDLNRDAQTLISVTTDTGFERAVALYGADRVVRYPLDFHFAVRRFLDRVRPDVIVLAELELWPRFLRHAQERSIPVAVVNGRLSERSFHRYLRFRALLRRSFATLAVAAVQDEVYARRFVEMGTAADRVLVTGTMKWDTAEIADTVPGAAELGAQMGIDRRRLLVVGGSTAPEEHELLRSAMPADAQLLVAPRRPEWFDEASRVLAPCVRRSEARAATGERFFVLDTIGELRRAYALADLVIIGRSFGQRHGSDMMEPVALGKATIVGPAVSDFQATADELAAAGGLIQTTGGELRDVVHALLADAPRRRELAARGRACVLQHQGATARNAAIIRALQKPAVPE